MRPPGGPSTLQLGCLDSTVGLFDRQEADNLQRAMPLAARMRPRTIDEFAGQQHFLGPGKLLRRMLDAERLVSVIFYGPPGTGKTSLAEVISRQTEREFVPLNAASCGVKELRAALDEAPRPPGRKWPAHHVVRRRAAPLQPHAAGSDAARRRIGGRGPHRRYDGQSVFLARLAPHQPQPGLRVPAPVARRCPRTLAPRLGRCGARLARYKTTVTDEALDFLAEVSDGDARRR